MTDELKHDTGKARWDLLPLDAIGEIAEVATYGATLYGDRRWESGMGFGRLLAAALRHIAAWSAGEDRDRDSGLSHLAHAACNLLFLIAYMRRGVGSDDVRQQS